MASLTIALVSFDVSRGSDRESSTTTIISGWPLLAFETCSVNIVAFWTDAVRRLSGVLSVVARSMSRVTSPWSSSIFGDLVADLNNGTLGLSTSPPIIPAKGPSGRTPEPPRTVPRLRATVRPIVRTTVPRPDAPRFRR